MKRSLYVNLTLLTKLIDLKHHAFFCGFFFTVARKNVISHPYMTCFGYRTDVSDVTVKIFLSSMSPIRDDGFMVTAPARLRIMQCRFELWLGHCVVFSNKTLYSHGASLSTQMYKWELVNLMLGVTLWWTKHPVQGEVEILVVASCYRNWDKLMGRLARISAEFYVSLKRGFLR